MRLEWDKKRDTSDNLADFFEKLCYWPITYMVWFIGTGRHAMHFLENNYISNVEISVIHFRKNGFFEVIYMCTCVKYPLHHEYVFCLYVLGKCQTWSWSVFKEYINRDNIYSRLFIWIAHNDTTIFIVIYYVCWALLNANIIHCFLWYPKHMYKRLI